MKELLSCAMDIGEQMLVCGAEVHRVEDSMQRICASFGADRINVFIITSSMVVTIYAPDGESFTETRRITGTNTDMEKLHRLNQLSRRICEEKLNAVEIKKALEQCLDSKPYPFWLVSICYAAIAGAFTAFFGGDMQAILLSPVVGFVTSLITRFAGKVGMNNIFERFCCSFVVTCLAFLFLKLGWIGSVDKVIIGNIMTLIPGIGLTNALRDLFVGDSIAGLLRFIEAALCALAIGAGYFVFIYISGGLAI